MAYPVSTSIHLYQNLGLTLNEQIEKHTDAGFRFLDFNFLDWQNVEDSPLLGDGWEAWIDGAGDTAARRGARFNQAHAPVPCLRFAKDYEGLVAAIRRSIRACHTLGIPQMVYHSLVYPEAYGLSGTWHEANRTFFRSLMDDAAKYGVGICVENVWPVCKYRENPVWQTDALIDFVDSLGDSDTVGICWDTGHGNLTGNGHNYAANANPELRPYGNQYENITKIGKRLRALHINDNNGLDDDHIMPGGGTIAWDDVIRALDDIGYQHSFTFEAHHAVIRVRPECKDAAARLLHDVGVALVNTSKNGKVFDN